MDFSIVELIKAMLAPGLMISACGLLVLGMNNKYSLVISRFRALEDEKRHLIKHQKENTLKPDEEIRLHSVNQQINKLASRIRLVRNAVICYSIAVGFFILSSFTIGFHMIYSNNVSLITLLLFLAGMSSVLVGICFASSETWKGYKIIQIERQE